VNECRSLGTIRSRLVPLCIAYVFDSHGGEAPTWEPPLKGSEPPREIRRRSQVAGECGWRVWQLGGSERALRGRATPLAGSERALRGKATPLAGSERALRGRATPLSTLGGSAAKSESRLICRGCDAPRRESTAEVALVHTLCTPIVRL
jgi:hypothetical protein